MKSVILTRSGAGRVNLSHFATRPVPHGMRGADQLAVEIEALLKAMGGNAKACSVAVSSNEAIIRILDQPETPTNLLREALRLNGMVLLNQDCRQFVLDCDRIVVTGPEALDAGKQRYLVGGLPRLQVENVQKAVVKAQGFFSTMQLGPISLLNAFEYANPEIFSGGGFFLVDVGATTTTMMVGARKELVLVRTVDIGGSSVLEALEALSGEPRESVIIALQQEDEMMIENARVAMINLSREIGNSIGFFEGRREETISRISVSGGMAKSRSLMRVLTEEVHVPCESWNPLATCEVGVPAARREELVEGALDLHVAYGAAAELIHS